MEGLEKSMQISQVPQAVQPSTLMSSSTFSPQKCRKSEPNYLNATLRSPQVDIRDATRPERNWQPLRRYRIFGPNINVNIDYIA